MKKIFLVLALILTSFVVSPIFVFAVDATVQTASQGITAFSGFITLITTTVVKSLATLLMSLALLAFFYGIVEYIWGKREGNTNKVKNGNQFITWGLVALFVMFSVYGIIKFGQGILFGSGVDVTTIKIPDINFNAGGSSSGNGDTGGSDTSSGNGGTSVGSVPLNGACQDSFVCSGSLQCVGGFCKEPSAGASSCAADYVWNGTSCIYNATFGP